MIISIVNLKGGVGKTTTTIYLATAYARMGNPTHVIDLDRQASAVDWAQSAAEDHDPLDFDVTLSVPKQLRRQAHTINPTDVLVIDTPPGDSDAIDAAINVADFVIVPAGLRSADITRVWDAVYTLENLGKPYAVLLTQVRPHTNAGKAVTTALQKQNTPTFENVSIDCPTGIPLRESISNSYRTKPTDLFGYDQVARDIFAALNVTDKN